MEYYLYDYVQPAFLLKFSYLKPLSCLGLCGKILVCRGYTALPRQFSLCDLKSLYTSGVGIIIMVLLELYKNNVKLLFLHCISYSFELILIFYCVESPNIPLTNASEEKEH